MDIEKAIKNLNKRGFKTSYFETSTQAEEYLLENIKGTTVGIGGSMTVDKMSLYEKLSENNTVWAHTYQPDRQKSLTGAYEANVYITSANAISEDGQIVNIDGTANRVVS